MAKQASNDRGNSGSDTLREEPDPVAAEPDIRPDSDRETSDNSPIVRPASDLAAAEESHPSEDEALRSSPIVRPASDLPALFPQDVLEAEDQNANVESDIQLGWWQRANFLKLSLIAAGVLFVLLLVIETLVLVNEIFQFSTPLAVLLLLALGFFTKLYRLGHLSRNLTIAFVRFFDPIARGREAVIKG